jgi:hypothetical protein
MADHAHPPLTTESVDYHAVGTSAIGNEDNPFVIAQRQLAAAAEFLKLDDATHQMLRWPVREMRG